MEINKQKNDLTHSTSHTLKSWYGLSLRLIFEGILIGTIVGLLIVFFRFSIDKISHYVTTVYSFIPDKPWLIPVIFISLIGIAVLIGLIIKIEPMVRGSGIPQVEGVLQRKLSMSWWRVILGKIVGGVLAIGSGLSLGREGPSVQIGAAVGQGYNRVFKRLKTEESFHITSGASAGLAAAFNAPLSGVIFALEEVHKSFSPLILLSAVSASITADFISVEFFGLKPIFAFGEISALPLNYYYYLLIIGILIGLFGVFFNFMLIKTKDFYVRLKIIPVQLRPIIPFVIAGILGIFYPQVLGSGNELITSLTENNFAIKAILMLLIVKFIFTILSYGSGVPGGIFLPLLVIGAVFGSLFGTLVSIIFNIDQVYINNFIILSMAGYFAAIVRAPITGIILITEMTGSFQHLLPLSIVVFTAYIIANLTGSEPIYESLLKRSLANEEYYEFKVSSKTKIMLELPVDAGSKLDNQLIKDIAWPEDCLLVSIRRGSEEKIPRGNTRIHPGDFLIVLITEDMLHIVRESLSDLSGHSHINTYYQNDLILRRVPKYIKKIFLKVLRRNKSNKKS
jgi:H+/Cl- antiporter ClcA